jgi:hypothetical protein
MTQRKANLLYNLVQQYSKLVDDGIEMSLEQRPHLWERMGIVKARENLESEIKENERKKQIMLEKMKKLNEANLPLDKGI